MKKVRYIILFSGLVLFFALLYYARFLEPNHITIEQQLVRSDKLADSGDSVKIVLISDLHMESYTKYLQKVVKRINQMNPDMIVVTGDYYHNSKMLESTRLPEIYASTHEIMNFLSGLKAKQGVYVTRGNNDFSNDREISNILVDSLQSRHIPLLANQGRNIQINGQNLYLMGVDFCGFSKYHNADFTVKNQDGNNVLQSGKSSKNSYSHFLKTGTVEKWQNYTFSGRFLFTSKENSGVGVTFYSKMGIGYDQFYRLRQAGASGEMQFSPHAATIYGDSLSTGYSMKANEWTRFKVSCRNSGLYTEMKAKVWPDSSAEPSSWMAFARDSSVNRLMNGAVGVWSAGPETHSFDDLLVVNDHGETLLDEDFEEQKSGKNPALWAAYNFGYEAIEALTSDVPPSTFSVLLAHTPDYIRFAKLYNIDLVLSGHTHGGQVQIPIISRLFSNRHVPKRLKILRNQFQGMYLYDNTLLYVTRGIGTAYIPIRFLTPPEITVFTLLPKEHH